MRGEKRDEGREGAIASTGHEEDDIMREADLDQGEKTPATGTRHL